MRRAVLWMVASGLALTGSMGRGSAAVITFDDLTTRDTFYELGIAPNYGGFRWGYSETPGLGGAVIPATNFRGWASATTQNPASLPDAPPTPVSGSSYAWNYRGVQSLLIDFQVPHKVNGAYFATLSETFALNAATVQLFGYSANSALVGSSSVLALTHSYQPLAAGFTNVRWLEIRANASQQWFSVDNLDVTPSTVPEPSSLALCGLGLAALLRRRRRV